MAVFTAAKASRNLWSKLNHKLAHFRPTPKVAYRRGVSRG
jgi:hypothetical protein